MGLMKIILHVLLFGFCEVLTSRKSLIFYVKSTLDEKQSIIFSTTKVTSVDGAADSP